MANPNFTPSWPLYKDAGGVYVSALPIKSIKYANDGSANAEFDGAYAEQYMSAQFVSVFKPQVGGYLFRSQYGELLYLSKADFEAEYSAGGGETVSWGDIEGKPTTFPPTIGTTATTAMAGNAKPATAGAADTAAKLATPRTITLTGAVTGSASFDGSGNITINTTSGA
ncbi:Decoration protein [Klebsiella aerogenes]|uniref:hypothetical protein n=1 Tax=Klebsiella aerogenes TaxID=548 RepID=UPI0007B3605A|nr:hypothetical protein [Klebsiella aerogenes]KZQ44733.1 Decoration protein [Klebsiella aerogenes]